MKTRLFIFLLIIGISSNANSQNLVLNPSFENLRDSCYPYLNGIWDSACLHWDSPTLPGTPDYMNVCSNSLLQGGGMGVPVNWAGGGFQYAKDGNAYAGYWHNVGGAIREYIQGTIQDSLTIGKKYKCYYYVSLQSMQIVATDASNNFGMGFTTYHVKQDSTWSNITNFQPKINDTTVISDTLNWVKVEGTFIADSAYKFFTIGNFFDEFHTKGLTSYYYLDDVHIEEVKGDGVEEVGKGKLEVYPNPASQSLVVNSKSSVNTIEVTDVLGRVCSIPPCKGGEGDLLVDVSGLSNGIYFIKATDIKGNILNGKFVKE
jgi:hypothetical protein